MLKKSTDIKNLDKLQKHIDFVNKMLKMKTDKTFQKFMQEKVLQIDAKHINRLMLFSG